MEAITPQLALVDMTTCPEAVSISTFFHVNLLNCYTVVHRGTVPQPSTHFSTGRVFRSFPIFITAKNSALKILSTQLRGKW